MIVNQVTDKAECFNSHIIALYINPKFVKALDRRSRVLELTGETEDALVDAVAAAVVDQFKTDSYFMHIEELLKTLSEAKAKELYAVFCSEFF